MTQKKCTFFQLIITTKTTYFMARKDFRKHSTKILSPLINDEIHLDFVLYNLQNLQIVFNQL